MTAIGSSSVDFCITPLGSIRADGYAASSDSRSRLIRTLVSLTTIPLLLGAGSEQWSSVARSEVKFAQDLAKDNTEFGPEFMRQIEKTVRACEPIPTALAGRSPREARQISLFCEYSCAPWNNAWAEALAPCEEVPVPKWCSGGRRLEDYLHFETYFETITVALRDSTTPLERYNIMAIVAGHVAENVLRDIRHNTIDDWLAQVVSAYLQAPPPIDAIAVAKLLNASLSLGRRSDVAHKFSEYADSTDSLSVAERRELHELAEGLREAPD